MDNKVHWYKICYQHIIDNKVIESIDDIKPICQTDIDNVYKTRTLTIMYQSINNKASAAKISLNT